MQTVFHSRAEGTRAVSGDERVKDHLSLAEHDRAKEDVHGMVPVVGAKVLAMIRGLGKTACATVGML